jgi:uncharacterized repeat protein (TIGR01451 family)/LPXTG-motif cell wall-anchored protein
MKKFKIITLTLLLSLASFVFASSTKAENLTITCHDEGPCDMSPAPLTPLFFETNMLPGDSVEQTLEVINEDEDDDCNLLMQVTSSSQIPPNFAQKLFTSLQKDGSDLFGSRLGSDALAGFTIQDIYNISLLDIGTLPASSSSLYSWLTTFDIDAGNEFQLAETIFDFEVNFSCGREEGPLLLLEKSNDTGGASQSPGDTVTYTLTLTANGANVHSVEVFDLPPESFDYQVSSWTGTPTEPTYSSPGVWNVGTILDGETKELTYQVTISSDTQPGVYPDLAWARGEYEESTIYANEDTYFVGTQVLVNFDQKPSIDHQGQQVLGASTELLPKTGSNTLFLALALASLTLGTTLIILSRKTKN